MGTGTTYGILDLLGSCIQTAITSCSHRPQSTPETPLVLTLHGFSASLETMLYLTGRLFGPRPVIASLQGPNQFFLPPDSRDVGYGWITGRRPSACCSQL
jgi:hypothetical protein